MKHTLLTLIALSFVACMASRSFSPGSPNGSVVQADNPRGERSASCTVGDTRMADDGCNHCTCEKGGWVCSTMGCAPTEPHAGRSKVADRCTPGAKVSVPKKHDSNPVMCDMLPPPCRGDMHRGAAKGCYLCVPNPAPPRVASECVCNHNAQWICTKV